MFFNAGQTEGAVGAVVPEKPSGPSQNRNLSPEQFGKKGGPATEAPEAGAAGGEAAAGGAAAEVAEVAPLLLL